MQIRSLAAAAAFVAAPLALSAQHDMAMPGHLQDSIVAAAKGAIGTMHDSVALHAAGYNAIGFGGGIKDLSPFQGQHWIQFMRFVANAPVDLNKPTFLMYLPVGDSLIPIGVAYTHRIPADAPLPTDLAGEKTEWHSHVICRNVPGEGTAIADGPDDCKAREGTAAPNQIAMVHTWTVANPDGPYAHDNPALPFIATGLTAPTHASHDDRLFGLALGESYGAKLPIARRIEFEATRDGKTTTLSDHRAKLRDLVTQLRAAQRANDAARFQSLRKNAIDEYGAIAAEYRRLSPSEQLRARYDAEYDMALDGMSHNHM